MSAEQMARIPTPCHYVEALKGLMEVIKHRDLPGYTTQAMRNLIEIIEATEKENVGLELKVAQLQVQLEDVWKDGAVLLTECVKRLDCNWEAAHRLQVIEQIHWNPKPRSTKYVSSSTNLITPQRSRRRTQLGYKLKLRDANHLIQN